MDGPILYTRQWRILIVDDDPNIRRMLRLSLDREGYAVEEAESGAQCIALLGTFVPDLILLDILMPGEMDGFQTLEQLRALPGGEDIPVLMVTALDDQRSVERAFAAGATDYIPKPVNRAVLVHRVRRVLRARQVDQELSAHRDNLEALVDARTAELLRANQALQREIQERRRVEAALEYRLDFERTIASISAHFINLPTDHIDNGINLALRSLGTFISMDRAYVCRFSDDDAQMNITHEWHTEEYRWPQAMLRDIPVYRFSWWMEALSRFEHVAVLNVADLPQEAQMERTFFEGRGVRSFISVPMLTKGQLVGMLGFESAQERATWPDDVAALLKIAAETLINALERKRTEEALYQSEQQLRQITDTMLDTVCRTDAQGIIEYASPSCWDVLGYAPSALVGHSLFAQVHPDDVERVREAILTVGQVEYQYRHADGHYVWLETLSNLVLGWDGHIAGIVIASRDITQRKLFEQETQELNRLKTEFLSTAAHELRTPLTSIRGFSEILLTRQLDADRQRRYLTLINEQSTHLGTIIDDLLDISRLEARRRLTLMLEPTSIRDLVDKAVMPFAEATPPRTIQVQHADTLPTVVCDSFRVLQVLKNLLSNAVKYSAPGTPISVVTRWNQSHVEVSVADRGIGMTPEQQAHLFEKFYRADASNTTASGTGLGLAISKLIVELHGGTIWAESQHGVGTTFHFSLPLAVAPQDEPAKLPSAS
jgi:PAS domain S-box-containing protein